MTSEAAGAGSVANVASEGLKALVETREKELRGEKPAAPDAPAKAQTEQPSQAEEVKAEEPAVPEKAPESPKGTGKAEEPKAPDFDWASDKLKRRLTDLYAKGHLDDDALADLKKDYLLSKGAYRKMEEAAEARKKADAEVASFREDAEAMRALLADERRKAAYLKALESGATAQADVPEDFDPLDPKQVFALARKAAADELEARDAKVREAAAAKQAKVRALEGWARGHRAALGDSVEDAAYESALDVFLKESLVDDPNLLDSMTEVALKAGVRAKLEKQRLEAELKELRDRSEGSKRDAARAASASSAPGIRASVEQAFDSKTLNGRVGKTLASIGGRENWNSLRR